MPGRILLLANLGAEEGDDFRALRQSGEARVAARLWSLLYGIDTQLCWPDSGDHRDGPWTRQSVGDLWPASFGSPPPGPAYDWLEAEAGMQPWLRTRSLEAELPASLAPSPTRPLLGAPPEFVERVHDKAFALNAARELGLLSTSLDGLLRVIDPEELRAPQAFLERLEASVAAWPDWTHRSFTLKPRWGTSGRGRVPGRWPLEPDQLLGALPRLALRGGAMLEPWFDRVTDLSVCLHLEQDPVETSQHAAVKLLGSLEMLATPGGVYAGHCGEIDSRGRVYSGHREDESARADAAAVAGMAHSAGYFGACGVDSFVYREGLQERLRPAVEFNARPTMGLVVMGLVRRLWQSLREPLGLEPGNRRAFLFALLPAGDADAADRIARRAQLTIPYFAMPEIGEAGSPRPYLFFGPDLESIRAAYTTARGC